MNTTVAVLIVIIPILLMSFGYMFFLFYKENSRKKQFIANLTGSNTKLLESEKTAAEEASADTFLAKKLSYAGFSQKNAKGVFLLISITTGCLFGAFIFFVIKSPVALVFSILIFSLFPYLVVTKIIRSREEEFNLFLKEIIDKVTSMMKSGVGFEQGLKKSVLSSHSVFTKKVFNVYINEKDIIGEDKAFEKMFTMVDSRELRIFYLTISIGRQSGGKFSNTLEKLRKTLHDQGEIKDQITSSTREIKIGTYMIIGILVFIFVLMNSSLDGIIYEHFFDTGEGKLQMFFITIWVAFGLFINNLLTKIK